ncbi:hypothetical protein FNV43_RR06639 [Rhamnella rubrinervis]|uniref:Uncharacterized protein n=1 Tax=Rhamnella rubrinervis TaxID=2594499 RepID=A0A8K0ML17_9ROSA|nr:hypothetical protein FNV43_RR06053 [Rhamnella rubrinervis]KAF3450552.1 hypothetical protein FNV43_RR06639 [Rhamnella rubrinervis]
MANARIARFITEAAPPQFVSVMRRRTSKVLDTINEEERDDSHMTSMSKGSSPASLQAKFSSSSASSSNYFLKEMRRSFSIIKH